MDQGRGKATPHKFNHTHRIRMSHSIDDGLECTPQKERLPR
jgi:hypothetical protein